jgi:hypothetical protein
MENVHRRFGPTQMESILRRLSHLLMQISNVISRLTMECRWRTSETASVTDDVSYTAILPVPQIATGTSIMNGQNSSVHTASPSTSLLPSKSPVRAPSGENPLVRRDIPTVRHPIHGVLAYHSHQIHNHHSMTTICN